MSSSFTNQTLAQIELWDQSEEGTRRRSYHAPEAPRRKGSRGSTSPRSAQASKCRTGQAAYIGLPGRGPYKPIITATERAQRSRLR